MDVILTIYQWFLFILLCIITTIPYIVYVAQFGDNPFDAGHYSYMGILSVVLSGFAFLTATYIWPDKDVCQFWIYIIFGIIVIHHIISLGNIRKSWHFFFSSLFMVLIFLFVISLKKDFWSTTVMFIGVDVHYIVIGIACVPIPLIVTKRLIMGKKDGRRSPKSYTFNLSNEIGQENERHSKEIEDIEFMSPRMSYLKIERLVQMNSERISDLCDKMETLSRDCRNLRNQRPFTNKKQKNKQSSNSDVLSQIRNDLSFIKEKMSNQTQNTNGDITNKTLVSELKHFLATPIANIETTIGLIASIEDKNIESLDKYMSRIKDAIYVCKGILATYSEIYQGLTNTEDVSLKDLINQSFRVYNKENKELHLDLNINEEHDMLSKYFVMTTLLPLLANAVQAAKAGTTIEIKEENNTIVLSNTFEGTIDVAMLEKEGFSTKQNHRGMGLFTVRHLLGSRKMPPMKIAIEDDRIYFKINIMQRNDI